MEEIDNENLTKSKKTAGKNTTKSIAEKANKKVLEAENRQGSEVSAAANVVINSEQGRLFSNVTMPNI